MIYKIFPFATHPTVLLYCMLLSSCKTLVWVESWSPWTGATTKCFSSASFPVSTRENSTMYFIYPSCARIGRSSPFRGSSTSAELGVCLHSDNFVSKVSCQSFNDFLMEFQGRKIWTFYWL
jgi:hypothetical protein